MDEEEGFLTCDKLTPIAIETVESGIAIHAGLLAVVFWPRYEPSNISISRRDKSEIYHR